jgi:hypothetical protein
LRVESLSLLAPAPAVVVRRSHKQAVGYQSVDVGVEIKVFAKGVQRHDDARNPLRAVQGGAEVFAEDFVGLIRIWFCAPACTQRCAGTADLEVGDTAGLETCATARTPPDNMVHEGGIDCVRKPEQRRVVFG